MGRPSNVTTPLMSGGRSSVTKFQPTYRIEPKIPYNREQCEFILKKVIDKGLEEFEYAEQKPEDVIILCETLCEDIKTRVKALNFDRYKLVCTVTIGEHFMQCYNNVMRCLWDVEKDGFAKYVYDTPNFFAIATIYAIYFE